MATEPQQTTPKFDKEMETDAFPEVEKFDKEIEEDPLLSEPLLEKCREEERNRILAQQEEHGLKFKPILVDRDMETDEKDMKDICVATIQIETKESGMCTVIREYLDFGMGTLPKDSKDLGLSTELLNTKDANCMTDQKFEMDSLKDKNHDQLNESAEYIKTEASSVMQK